MAVTGLQRSERFVDGEVSYWYRDIGLPDYRPALDGDRSADVAIVGGGLTGLWTAYYLKRQQPDLDVVVLEREFAGFGASGRNGGWLSAEPPGSLGRYAAERGHASAAALQRAMFDTVDEVIAVARREGIDADIVKDGMLRVATNEAQVTRLYDRISHDRFLGWGPEDLQLLGADDLRARVSVAGARAATYSPHCARIQPAKLVRGLAAVVEGLGVSILEQTEVTGIEPGLAITSRGRVRADYVIRALEGYTAGLAGHKRTWLPMNSSMVVTEPLSDAAWEEIGWRSAEVLGTEAHGFAYVQRTTDGRIALGGRAVPYRYGSRTDVRGETFTSTFDQLRAVLGRLFPAAREADIDHAWAGVLGVPRDWCATVTLDRTTGLGWAGGYVGHGVTSTNLAGRTLADLILGTDSERVALPWVDHRVRTWEPEPARWLGVRGLYLAYHAADRRENAARTPRTSRIAAWSNKISGR